MLRADGRARAGSALPDDVLVELASIYVDGVEAMQRQVMELFSGARGDRVWDPAELAAFQQSAAAAAGQLLPLVTRIVEYVHQRTLQRLTLGAIERGARRRRALARGPRSGSALPPVIFARSSSGIAFIVSSITLREYGQSLPWCG